MFAIAGCSGVLHEKPNGIEVDAGAIDEIPAPACAPAVASPGTGHHNPGEDCLMCHYQGGADMAPPFTFAGTLFDSSGGSAPVAGTTIHLIDAVGNQSIVVSEDNGNFYSTDLLVYPVRAFTSLCPDVARMVAPLGEADGSCNRSGCHTSGFRLH